jgi:hypothetical protein
VPGQPLPERAEGPDHDPNAFAWITFFCLLACIYVAAALVRGRFLDEFWTVGYADARVPFRLLFDDWSADSGHPITFNLLNLLLAPLVPAGVVAGRLLNLVYLAAAILAAWFYDRGGRRFGLLFCGALASSYFVIERFSQFRATFLALMVLAVIVIAVRKVLETARPQFGDGLVLMLLCGALGLIEYPVSIGALALCGALGLISLLSRNWRQVMVAVESGVAGLAAIFMSLANASRFPLLPPPYWQTMRGLSFDLAQIAATAQLPCLALIVLFVIQMRRTDRPWAKVLVATEFRRCIALAICLTLIGYVVVNAATHALVKRHLLAIIPLLIALPVDVVAQDLHWTGKSRVLVLISLLIAALLSLVPLRSKLDFDRYGRTLASAQKSCPSLPIYALLPEQISHLGKGMPLPYPIDARQMGYDQVARDYGFRLSSLGNAAPRIDSDCGASIWSETLWIDRPLTPALVYERVGIKANPQTLAHTQFFYASNSLLMRVPAAKRQNVAQS